MEAAFFDVDKTVIAKASIMAFARDFRREGLLTRRTLASGACRQIVYVRWGASARRLDRARRSVLNVTRGWDQAHVRAIVTAGLGTVIDPITFIEARSLIADHLRLGRRVYLVSAAPAEIVEPLAEHLGVHGAVASLARLDRDGRYTGELERYASGEVKAEVMRQIAEAHDVDLARSFAYSDSATDLPMLEAVGHPVAVNPDRTLRRIARGPGLGDPAFRATHGRVSPGRAGGRAQRENREEAEAARGRRGGGSGRPRRRHCWWCGGCRVAVPLPARTCVRVPGQGQATL